VSASAAAAANCRAVVCQLRNSSGLLFASNCCAWPGRVSPAGRSASDHWPVSEWVTSAVVIACFRRVTITVAWRRRERGTARLLHSMHASSSSSSWRIRPFRPVQQHPGYGTPAPISRCTGLVKLEFNGSSILVASWWHSRRHARHPRDDATRVSRVSGDFHVLLASRLRDWSAGG